MKYCTYYGFYGSVGTTGFGPLTAFGMLASSGLRLPSVDHAGVIASVKSMLIAPAGGPVVATFHVERSTDDFVTSTRISHDLAIDESIDVVNEIREFVLIEGVAAVRPGDQLRVYETHVGPPVSGTYLIWADVP